ncbi:hypothetical protein ACFL5M_05445 [Candidatus Neomarinimicrobiota bacterium]
MKRSLEAFSSLEEIAGAEVGEIAEKAKVPLEVAEKVRERAKQVEGKDPINTTS